jgi:1,5-anhydro-D-fructose reductase (1,5-anhydro-D-mannitol-forming)
MVGTGSIADKELAPALGKVERAEFHSVLSRDKQRGMQFAERHGAKGRNPVYTELDLLLSDPGIDAVIIATPDKLHAEQAITAARAGKHVLVEKPMATDVESGRAMVRACEEAGVVLAVAYHMRWHNGLRKIAKAAQAGHMGTIRHMRVLWTAQSSDPSDWRASPEVGRWWALAAVGTHCLDLIRWLMVPSCGEIESLESTISKKVWRGPHDETAIVSVRFESGATAEFCNSVVFQAPSRLEIYGSGGYAICDEALGRHGTGRIRTHEGDVEYDVANPYLGEIRDFVAAIQENRPPEVDGKEGLRNVELLVEATSRRDSTA